MLQCSDACLWENLMFNLRGQLQLSIISVISAGFLKLREEKVVTILLEFELLFISILQLSKPNKVEEELSKPNKIEKEFLKATRIQKFPSPPGWRKSLQMEDWPWQGM